MIEGSKKGTIYIQPVVKSE